MFKITVKTDYGLMIMRELAERPGEVISLSGLAKRVGTSSIYLIQVARPLIQAGLIKSKEGAGGGYFLARAAKKISLLEIFEALDGRIAMRCASGSKCSQQGACRLKGAWGVILEDLKVVLRRKSLASLLD